MWTPPRARKTCPDASGAPSKASATLAGHMRFNRWAKFPVNVAGMCWTMTVGGQFSGKRESTVIKASTPPVEEPIATTRPSG